MINIKKTPPSLRFWIFTLLVMSPIFLFSCIGTIPPNELELTIVVNNNSTNPDSVYIIKGSDVTFKWFGRRGLSDMTFLYVSPLIYFQDSTTINGAIVNSDNSSYAVVFDNPDIYVDQISFPVFDSTIFSFTLYDDDGNSVNRSVWVGDTSTTLIVEP